MAGADLVARARIEGAAAPAVGDSGERRPRVRATLLEVFKGGVSRGQVRFAQHGHGVAVFEPGAEVLLFLKASQHSRELAGLAAASDLRWVSVQEHGADLALEESSRAAFVEAVASGAAPAPSGADGLAALHLADKAAESAETGQPVKI